MPASVDAAHPVDGDLFDEQLFFDELVGLVVRFDGVGFVHEARVPGIGGRGASRHEMPDGALWKLCRVDLMNLCSALRCRSS